MYDKDVFSKDFLGKVTLTVEKLKEISHKVGHIVLELFSQGKYVYLQILNNIY